MGGLWARALLASAIPALVGIALAVSGAGTLTALLAAAGAAAMTAAWMARAHWEELGRMAARGSSVALAERRDAEAERDRLEALVARLGDAILILDPSDRVRLANPAAERILAAAPLVGRRAVDVVRDHEVLEVLERARQGGESSGQVERAQPQRLLRAVAQPLPGGELLLAIQDLSALRRLETVRADFVANVSHELRTPLASLRAMAETLAAGALEDPAAARDFLARMLDELDGLARLVEELLSLTRIESGAEPLVLADVDPGRALQDAAQRLAPLASRAGVELEVSVAAPVPPVRADAEKIAQVLANLVHNAVKFTPPGGRVTLGARSADGRVAFQVGDTGAGLAPAELDRVFERFYKGDRSRASGGTGLGLAIAKHIVEAHGGEIHAASEGAGRGATFTFTLPSAR